MTIVKLWALSMEITSKPLKQDKFKGQLAILSGKNYLTQSILTNSFFHSNFFNYVLYLKHFVLFFASINNKSK